MASKHKIIEYLIYAAAVLALLGFSDAAYLTATHYSAVPATCIITSGCDVVLRSPYSELLGLPVALFGVIYYLSVFAVALGFIGTKNRTFLRLLVLMLPAGFAASAYFLYIQAAVLGAYCSLCLFSALISGLLLAGGIVIITQTYEPK